ncbi:hypothetical protein NHX12_022665 [Muraenolepis orangiensis]|uniref:Uncharacterized protein n=1 Tax=Muraenolepis orangiensis TaxID=630683 RepID=A0A9Q0IUJ6_9TELE|nr:hypothetical protein NHX12_022665 [Muraenolepis orangiensis]
MVLIIIFCNPMMTPRHAELPPSTPTTPASRPPSSTNTFATSTPAHSSRVISRKARRSVHTRGSDSTPAA